MECDTLPSVECVASGNMASLTWKETRELLSSFTSVDE